MYHYILQVYQELHKENDWVTKEVFINHPDLIPIGDPLPLAPDSRRHYFEGRYLEFKKNLKALDTVTEPLYIHDHDYVENLLSGLVSSFSDCRSSYVMESDNPPVPFDKFIRTAVPGMPYYIGAVLEYHC